MKIRIKGNSIRIRVSKTEVDTFCQIGYLEEVTEFGDSRLSYRLERVQNDGNLNAAFARDCITMLVPEHLVKGWDANNVVGFNYTKPLGDDKGLFLLLEKDFKCIDSEVLEDQSDNFDNPLHTCS